MKCEWKSYYKSGDVFAFVFAEAALINKRFENENAARNESTVYMYVRCLFESCLLNAFYFVLRSVFAIIQ